MKPDGSTSGAERLRVLATAYACEPALGSEPGIGWNWARQIALHHELTLVTRKNNVAAIRKAAAKDDLQLEVIGHDLPERIMRWKRGGRGAMAYYYAWQKSLDAACAPLLDTHSFDVAHHITFASGWIPSGLARLDLPFVFGPVGEHPSIPSAFLRGHDVVGRFADRFRRVAKSSLPRVDRSVRETWEAANVILSLGRTFEERLPDAAKARLQPMLACGVDARSIADPTPRLQGAPLRLLFAGRLIDLKGVRLAMHAFSLLENDTPATLELIGVGPERKRLERMASSAGVMHRVTFRGKLSHEDTLAAMRNADVFLFPSFEGAGMVVPEAMSAGCTVVCLDHGGPGEMVANGRGVAVPLEDSLEATASEISMVLSRLASNENARLQIAECGNEWVRQAGTWNAKGLALNSIYRRARQHFNYQRAGRTNEAA